MTPLLKLARGDFKVIRFCCTSGNCLDCRAGWDKSRRRIVTQMDDLSEGDAHRVAANWSAYEAQVVPMARAK